MSRLEIADARRLLAIGHSFQYVADELGVFRRCLDFWLWHWIGT